jgi:hypothetical protein
MTSDEQDRPVRRRRTRRPAGRDLVVVGGALLYAVLGLLPWASVTYDVLGRISASGYGLSVLVPVAAVLLAAAAGWTLLPADRRPAVVPAGAVPAGLAALAFLLTLVTALRGTDYGFEPVPLLALGVAGAVAGTAARAVPAQLREQRPAPAGPVPGGSPAAGP